MNDPEARVWFLPLDGSFDPERPTVADLENGVEITQALTGEIWLTNE